MSTSLKRLRDPSQDKENEAPKSKRQNTGEDSEPFIYANNIQHTTHWTEAEEIIKSGQLKFKQMQKDDDRPEKMKPLESCYLIWFGLNTKYPAFHKLANGSRYGTAQFTLRTPGCPVDRYKEEFALNDSDIKIWKLVQPYYKEVSLCYLFTTIDHQNDFPAYYTLVSVEQWRREHLDSTNRMCFRLKKYTDGKYDTISFAFERPANGWVWNINPLTARLNLVEHLPSNILCKKGIGCTEISPESNIKESWETKSNEWNKQAVAISQDDESKLNILKSKIERTKDSLGQKQFKEEITHALFQRICDCMQKSGAYSLTRAPHENGSIRYEVTRKDITFCLDYYYGKVTLASGFNTGKQSLMYAIDGIISENAAKKTAPKPGARKFGTDVTNQLQTTRAYTKVVPPKMPNKTEQVKRTNVTLW